MAENDNGENNAHKSNAPFVRKYDRNISSLRTDLQPDAAFRKPTVSLLSADQVRVRAFADRPYHIIIITRTA